MSASHIADEALERYSLQRSSDEEIETVEEHLLVCDECRARLDRADSYHRTMRTALRRVNAAPEKSRSRAWLPAMAVTGAFAVAAVVAIPAFQSGPSSTIEMAAMRGVESYTAPAGHSLKLRVDLTGVSTEPWVSIEIADARGGSSRMDTPAKIEGGRAVIDAGKLAPGQYWVRIKSSTGELLRETGLLVRR